MSSTISRSVMQLKVAPMVIYLDCMLPYSSNNNLRRYFATYPKARWQPYRFMFGLASGGVYICPFCYQKSGGLLHHLSILTILFHFIDKQFNKIVLAVYFCCTSLGVASTGCYPAPCPMKPGLSSPVIRCDHLCYSRFIF